MPGYVFAGQIADLTVISIDIALLRLSRPILPEWTLLVPVALDLATLRALWP